MRKAFYFITACFFMLCFGCAEWKHFADSASPYKNPSYAQILKDWTREARIYKGFETKLIANITFKSKPFSLAYSSEYALSYALSAEAKEKLLQDEKDATDNYLDFVMAVYVPEPEWDDFDAKNPTWKIYLKDTKNQQIEAAEITKIKLKNQKDMGHFFPYASPWKSFYSIRFERKNIALGKSLRLLITSVHGSSEVSWELP